MATPTKTTKAAKPAAAKPEAAATKVAAPKKAAPKKAAAAADPAAPKKVDALQKPLQPSPELAEIVGKDVLPRGQVVSKVWEYIRKHNLQNPADKREILADDKLKKVFGRDKCTMFEMNKYLAQHLK
ncbi:MAG: SWIB/MDM2 domain-containing protein [Janthinobacterium lividum]